MKSNKRKVSWLFAAAASLSFSGFRNLQVILKGGI